MGMDGPESLRVMMAFIYSTKSLCGQQITDKSNSYAMGVLDTTRSEKEGGPIFVGAWSQRSRAALSFRLVRVRTSPGRPRNAFN